jgi:hypothetical protein
MEEEQLRLDWLWRIGKNRWMDFLRRFGLRGITASIGRGLPVRLSSFLLDLIPLVALSCTFIGKVLPR